MTALCIKRKHKQMHRRWFSSGTNRRWLSRGHPSPLTEVVTLFHWPVPEHSQLRMSYLHDLQLFKRRIEQQNCPLCFSFPYKLFSVHLMLKKCWMTVSFFYPGEQKDKSVMGSLRCAANVYHFCLGRMASRDDRRDSATANYLSLETRVQLVLITVVNLWSGLLIWLRPLPMRNKAKISIDFMEVPKMIRE